MLDRLNTDCGGRVAFACSGSADQYDILGCFDELALMQLPHFCFVDLTGRKVEAGEIFVRREAGDHRVVGN